MAIKQLVAANFISLVTSQAFGMIHEALLPYLPKKQFKNALSNAVFQMLHFKNTDRLNYTDSDIKIPDFRLKAEFQFTPLHVNQWLFFLSFGATLLTLAALD